MIEIMVHLIDKDALVAEIDKGINGRNDWQFDNYRKGYYDALVMLKKYLFAFEVKEVDLEKEIKRFTMSKELYEADSVIKDCKEPASQNDFKPYQKVLTRMEDGESWEADLFGTYKPLCDNPYHCVGGWWPQCIPYEGNEHLLGTHNNCDKYYVTWEE